jgi:hypothetical protein
LGDVETMRKPLNPVHDEHVRQFEEYVHKWRALLNLRDWRIARTRKRPARVMAVLESVEHEHKLARYSVGRDFGAAEVTPESLESTALHELLHLLLRPLLDVAMEHAEHNDVVLEYEHAVITVLEELLMKAYGTDADTPA